MSVVVEQRPFAQTEHVGDPPPEPARLDRADDGIVRQGEDSMEHRRGLQRKRGQLCVTEAEAHKR